MQNPTIINPPVNSSGSYSVLVTSTDGCTNTAVCNVTVTALPTLSLSSNSPVCEGANLALSANINTVSSVSWVGPNNFTANTINVSIMNAQVLATGIYSFNITNGPCALSRTTHVIVNPLPLIAVSGGTICSGQSFTFNPSGASNYSYSLSGPVVSPTATSGYTITGSTQSGCTNSVIATINVMPLPVLSVSGGSICSGQSFTLNPSGASSYSYSLSGPIVSPTVTSGYTITGISLQSGCTNSIHTIINVNQPPIITFSLNQSLICLGEITQLFATGANTYTWNTGISGASLIVSPSLTTTYSVTGTDINGCVNTAVITQSVDACLGIKNEELKVKNEGVLIYPNPGNGLFNVEITEYAELKIYNTLGQLILSKNINVGKSNIDLHQYNNGIYFVEVKKDTNVITTRLIKE